jgi:hypothetical protein
MQDYSYDDLNWDGSTRQPNVSFFPELPPKPAESCAEIIAKARAEGKYLFELTNMVYFSPAALERLQSEGKFRWSPYNFSLVHPDVLKTDKYYSEASGYHK